jgi:hypothetical protein
MAALAFPGDRSRRSNQAFHGVFSDSSEWQDMAGGNWILFCNVDPALYIQYVNIELPSGYLT